MPRLERTIGEQDAPACASRRGRGLWFLLVLVALAGGLWMFGVPPFRSPAGEAPASEEPVALQTRRPTARAETLVEQLISNADPTRDGWDTEVWNDAIGKQLGRLQERLETPGTAAADPLCSPDFAGMPILCSPLESVFDDGAIVVQRWDPRGEASETVRGERGLADEFGRIRAFLGVDADSHLHAKFKLFSIEPLAPDDSELAQAGGARTRLYFEAGSHDAREAKELTATLEMTWTFAGDGESAPLLSNLRVEELETVAVQAQGGRLFADVTLSALGSNPAYRDQHLAPLNHWVTRLTRITEMWIFGHHGLAIGDVNDDGLDDLYVCDAGGLPNRLYVQNPDGTATDRSAEAGVDWLELSTGALFVDLDGDADEDLVVATRPQIVFAENDGQGRFKIRDALAVAADPLSIAAADPDGDGDLDVYVCVYNPEVPANGLPAPVPYYDAENGGTNVFLQNDGDFRFRDVTADVGLDVNNSRFSFAASWEDYDNDGDVDLYVANDFGRNNLYRNDGGRFVDVAPEAAVEDVASGMSIVWGDVDRDGWMDAYVSNMFSSAGNRITFQPRFSEGRAEEAVAAAQRMARGNTLFTGSPDGVFSDSSESAGVTLGRWAWSSVIGDINNDGWEDIVVANGYLTNDDPADL